MNNLFSSSPAMRFTGSLLGIALILSASVTGAAAQSKLTGYTDVEAGAWYEGAASALLSSGALDESELRLRPNDLATRAELVKLLVRVNDMELVYPSTTSFNDVPRVEWYFPYFETAAEESWVRGDNNCYQRFRPCTARPSARVNRSEAAALLVRAFTLRSTGDAPEFLDNRDGNEWFHSPIQIAADHCILQGDELSDRVRPSSFMNRAEMIVMFDRASRNLTYGEDCGVSSPEAGISRAVALSFNTIELRFTVDVNLASAEDETRYRITNARTNGRVIIRGANRTSANTVELSLGSALLSRNEYDIDVIDLSSVGGSTFSDSVSIMSPSQEAVVPKITTVDVLSPSQVRVHFDANVSVDRATDEARYKVTDGSVVLDVDRADIVDARTVELRFAQDMRLQAAHTLTVNGLESQDGILFSDTVTFVNDDEAITFTAVLRGTKQVPIVITTASGSGSFTLREDGLSYDITVKSLSGAITGAHFHRGPSGSNGSVLETITFTGNRATGVWQDLTTSERDSILDEQIYVNIHTALHPDGEIRGQVERD